MALPIRSINLAEVGVFWSPWSQHHPVFWIAPGIGVAVNLYLSKHSKPVSRWYFAFTVLLVLYAAVPFGVRIQKDEENILRILLLEILNTLIVAGAGIRLILNSRSNCAEAKLRPNERSHHNSPYSRRQRKE